MFDSHQHRQQPSSPVAVVTGASRGIGAATVREFISGGYRVVAVARSREGLEQVASSASPGSILTIDGDLADLDFAATVIATARERCGRIDVLINNAAWRELGTMRTVSIESWERTLRVCLTAPAFLARWAAEVMEHQGGGTIINVSSIQAERAPGMVSQYVAAKGGLDALTRDLAALYGPVGIRVLSVHPGTIATEAVDDYRAPDGASTEEERARMIRDLVPLRRRGAPGEVARVLTWLAGDGASYITGTIVTVDGGWTVNLTPYGIKRLTFPDDFAE